MKMQAYAALSLLAVAMICGAWLWTPDKPRTELEAKYLQSPDDMRVVAGVRLHVRDSGAKHAAALIMLHGFGSSLQTWEPWARLLQTHYRVVRVDLPGSGLSSPDPTNVYTDTRSIEVLSALMDQLGIARATLIGNSIGGRIAWVFAATHPERVAKLVLISPDGFASAGFNYGIKPTVPVVVRLMRYALPRAMLRQNLAAAYGDPARLNEQTVDRCHDLMLGAGTRDALIARMEQTVLENPEPLLRQVRAPVLLLWGEEDHMIPIANAADYQRLLSTSTLARLPALGHVPQEEAPETALWPVMSFLAQ